MNYFVGFGEKGEIYLIETEKTDISEIFIDWINKYPITENGANQISKEEYNRLKNKRDKLK